MSSFLKNPNLPEGNASSLICGCMNEELTDYFKRRDIDLFCVSKNESVDKAVSEHADLSALYLGNGRIIIDRKQTELITKLTAEGFTVTETEGEVTGSYPGDCILNHTVTDRYIIGNSRILDESVKSLTGDLEIIHVNQGYCKCSVLVVDEASIITDDESIARNAAEKGLDCLLISKGDVLLIGHEYGFIGGASGKISKDEIIFFGDISAHRDYERIKQFITERKMKIVSFTFPLTDFGGIIPIKENIL